MPLLRYDELDVLECLGALPEPLDANYPQLGAHYRTEREGLVLTLTFWRYEGRVHVVLEQFGNSEPIVELMLFVRDRVTRRSESYRDGRWRDWLEFSQCIVTGNQYPGPSDNEPGRVTVEISAHPKIGIRFA